MLAFPRLSPIEPNPACQVTHGQIASGKCPWCQQALNQRTARQQLASARSGVCVWDLVAMQQGLRDADPVVRSATVTNLVSEHGPELETLTPLLGEALKDASAFVRKLARDAMPGLGKAMNADEVSRLRSSIQTSSDGLGAKYLLLASYLLGAEHAESMPGKQDK